MLDLKLSTAVYVFNGLLTKAELAEADRTRLMKLLYLTNIAYLAPMAVPTPVGTPFADYHYTAFPNGPLEEYVYSYIEKVRRYAQAEMLDDGIAKMMAPYKQTLDAAITQVRDVFVPKETSWLINFTHNGLSEWAKTEIKEKLAFNGGYGKECADYRSYINFVQNNNA